MLCVVAIGTKLVLHLDSYDWPTFVILQKGIITKYHNIYTTFKIIYNQLLDQLTCLLNQTLKMGHVRAQIHLTIERTCTSVLLVVQDPPPPPPPSPTPPKKKK